MLLLPSGRREVLNRSKAAPVDWAVFIANYVIAKRLSLLPRKDLLIYFFCCFLKLLSPHGCLGTRWDEGVVCGSHSFYVTLQNERRPSSVRVQHTRPGCMSQDRAAWALWPALPPSPLSPPAWCCPLPAPCWGWNLWALHGSLKKYHPGKRGRFTLWFGQIIFFAVSLLKNYWEGENKTKQKKAHLTSFNTARVVLISHAFLGPYFLPCDLQSNSIFHSCCRKCLSAISNTQLHLSLLEEM